MRSERGSVVRQDRSLDKGGGYIRYSSMPEKTKNKSGAVDNNVEMSAVSNSFYFKKGNIVL
jgi:hypothetical protein